MALTSDIYLEITSPQKQVLGRMVGKVTLPGGKGRFTVLTGHAPIISSLIEGDIVYSEGDKDEAVHIKSGFVEVRDNKVSVCAEI